MAYEWYDFTAGVGGTLCVIAAFYLLAQPRGRRFSRRALPAWIVLIAFAGALVWSMWSETVRPLVEEGETSRAIRTSFGMVAILAAVVAILYGGFRIVSKILKTLRDPTVVKNAELIRQRRHQAKEVVRKARRANSRAILRGLYPGSVWMIGGFALLALGGWLGS
ncbi:MAG: hypothetical protein N3B14_00660 [Thermoleophilia bacterium]|nr:hypothetical protein [Thermoleophilia bacterium]